MYAITYYGKIKDRLENYRIEEIALIFIIANSRINVAWFNNHLIWRSVHMRFFDIFKKKDKKDTDIENSLNDYFHKLEKYKKLNKGEVGSIPDVDLKTAVMSWIRGKFNEDWTNQYEVIESLPKPCRHVYACCTVIDEVSNGGLNQLFLIQQDSLRMEYKLYFNPTGY